MPVETTLELPGSQSPNKPSAPNWRPRIVRNERLTHRSFIDNASALSARLNLLKRQQIENANKVYRGVRRSRSARTRGTATSPSCTL